MTKVRSRGKSHIDHEQVRLRKDAEEVIRYGTVEEFKEILRRAGKNPESPECKALIDRFISLGASGHSQQ